MQTTLKNYKNSRHGYYTNREIYGSPDPSPAGLRQGRE